jgi:hypothetical protein
MMISSVKNGPKCSEVFCPVRREYRTWLVWLGFHYRYPLYIVLGEVAFAGLERRLIASKQTKIVEVE